MHALARDLSRTINFRLAGSPRFEKHKKKGKPCLVYIKGGRVSTPRRQVAIGHGLFYCDTSEGATDFPVECVRVSGCRMRWCRLNDRIVLDDHSSVITSQSAWDLVCFW